MVDFILMMVLFSELNEFMIGSLDGSIFVREIWVATITEALETLIDAFQYSTTSKLRQSGYNTRVLFCGIFYAAKSDWQ